MRRAAIALLCLSWFFGAGNSVSQEPKPAHDTGDDRILYEKWLPYEDRQAWGEFVEVWWVRPDGTERERLTSGAYDVGVARSPEGSQIAFSRRGEIQVMNLAERSLLAVPADGRAHSPQWLDDDTLIFAVALGPEEQFNRRWRLVRTDVATGEFAVLDTGELTGVFAPKLSPDRSRIAFHAWEGEEAAVYLAAMDDLAGSAKRLVHGDEVFPTAWSPDGKRLAIIRGRDCLWTDGESRPKRAPVDATECNLSWSPSGDRIVFQKSSGLWISDSRGREERLLVAGEDDDGHLMNPSWSSN